LEHERTLATMGACNSGVGPYGLGSGRPDVLIRTHEQDPDCAGRRVHTGRAGLYPQRTRQVLLDVSDRGRRLLPQDLARRPGSRQTEALADCQGASGTGADAARYGPTPAAAVLYRGGARRTAHDDDGPPARRPEKIRPCPPGTRHRFHARDGGAARVSDGLVRQAGTDGVVQIRVTRETWNPLASAALATFGVTQKRQILNHASPNNRAARAEASTTLTVISIGADQGGGLARRLQSEPANLGEDFGRRRGTVFLHGRLDDRQEFALQRSVVPLGTLPQALHDPVRRVLDREVDGHGSESAPGWMSVYHACRPQRTSDRHHRRRDRSASDRKPGCGPDSKP